MPKFKNKTMNLFIPEIGTKLKSTSDWTFVLYQEYRNSKMISAICQTFSWGRDQKSWLVTVPAETIISIDRIYVRKGVSDFSSVTFTIPKVLNKKSKFAGSRFWVKLSDVNKVEFELVSCNEDTLNLIKKIDEKTKEVLPSITQSHFMKMLLDGKTVNMIRPQEPPSYFVIRVYSTMVEFCKKEKLEKDIQLKLERALISFVRAHKIASLPIEKDDDMIQVEKPIESFIDKFTKDEI